MAAGGELGEHGAAGEIDELLDLVGAEAGNRRERAHAAGVRAAVAVVGALEVLRDRERARRDAVAEREHRHLGPLEQLLDDERAGEPVELGEPGRDLGLRRADDDALAGGEPVGLEHARRHRLGERRRGRHARGGHHVLRERLRALDRRGGARRAEHRDPDRAEHVGEARDERHLGADDDEIDLERAGEAEHGLDVVGPHRMAVPERGDAGVAGRGMQLASGAATGRASRPARARGHRIRRGERAPV